MKIAVVAEPFVPIPPKKYGGIERVIYYLVKGIQESEHEVVLLAPGDSTIDCELIPITDKHFFFGKDIKEQEKIMKKNAEVRKNTIKILKDLKQDIDIIHSHGLDLTEFKDFPNLTTLHGIFTLSHVGYYSNRKDLNYVTISQNQQKSYPPDMKFAGVVYNGLDPDKFEFNDEPEDYLLFIGRLDEEKNPKVAIELALNLNMKIKLAGKVDFQGAEYFKKQIEPHLSNPLVEYVGEVGMEDKIKLMKNAKCNLHLINFREPFGLTVIESAYCGTPTLAFNRGSMSELIEDGRSGAIVEDISEGYHQIQECFNMDRKYISERARLLFNYKKMTEDYIDVYEQIINQDFKKNLNGKSQHMRDNFYSSIEAFWAAGN